MPETYQYNKACAHVTEHIGKLLHARERLEDRNNGTRFEFEFLECSNKPKSFIANAASHILSGPSEVSLPPTLPKYFSAYFADGTELNNSRSGIKIAAKNLER